MSDNRSCDACGTVLGDPVYHPVRTKRNMAVFECRGCGLCQSLSLAPFEPDRTRTLSCDSDWGNVRHGKGARFDGLKPWLDKVDFKAYTTALDVGANRGNFVLWLRGAYPGISITALEPDGSVTAEYRDADGMSLIVGRFEASTLQPADFIYNVHTLEHATSARSMLHDCRALLNPGGRMLLEVPNLAVLQDPDNVEEFFIDKHTFHFAREPLRRLASEAGFEIVEENADSDRHNITMLLAPGHRSECRPGEVQSNADLFRYYETTMTRNRERLREVAQSRIIPLAARQKLGFWGAGRIFNALVKYGGIRREHVHCLVDRHLWQIIDNNEGIPIGRPESLKQANPDVVIVLGRASQKQMADQARAMGFRHVVTLQSLMAQA